MYTDRQVRFSKFCFLPLLPRTLDCLFFFPSTKCLHLLLGLWLGVSPRKSHESIAFEVSLVVVHRWAFYRVNPVPLCFPFLLIILTKVYFTCGGERQDKRERKKNMFNHKQIKIIKVQLDRMLINISKQVIKQVKMLSTFGSLQLSSETKVVYQI